VAAVEASPANDYPVLRKAQSSLRGAKTIPQMTRTPVPTADTASDCEGRQGGSSSVGLEVMPFADEHLDAAADLLAERHRRDRLLEPDLPASRSRAPSARS
jgi:hypothetical protein